MAGDRPSIESRSGLSIISKNCLAYAESDSTYRLWPSAYMVSNASVDLPEPERPVITTSLFFGMSRLIFFKLCSLAPRITNLSFISPILFVSLLACHDVLLLPQSQALLHIVSSKLQLRLHMYVNHGVTCVLFPLAV